MLYLTPDEASVTGIVGVTQATALQKYHPAVGGVVSPNEETSSSEVVAESSRIGRVPPSHDLPLLCPASGPQSRTDEHHEREQSTMTTSTTRRPGQEPPGKDSHSGQLATLVFLSLASLQCVTTSSREAAS